jgi:hypothetical protein
MPLNIHILLFHTLIVSSYSHPQRCVTLSHSSASLAFHIPGPPMPLKNHSRLVHTPPPLTLHPHPSDPWQWRSPSSHRPRQCQWSTTAPPWLTHSPLHFLACGQSFTPLLSSPPLPSKPQVPPYLSISTHGPRRYVNPPTVLAVLYSQTPDPNPHHASHHLCLSDPPPIVSHLWWYATPLPSSTSIALYTPRSHTISTCWRSAAA